MFTTYVYNADGKMQNVYVCSAHKGSSVLICAVVDIHTICLQDYNERVMYEHVHVFLTKHGLNRTKITTYNYILTKTHLLIDGWNSIVQVNKFDWMVPSDT